MLSTSCAQLMPVKFNVCGLVNSFFDLFLYPLNTLYNVQLECIPAALKLIALHVTKRVTCLATS